MRAVGAYYNEIDPYAAQWLRNLIAKGLIADGEVDTRSIVDVSPDELRGFTQCHFFAGIGGWSHALRLAGWSDIRSIWTGSCPCQPFSVAGKGVGTDDSRHLWPHFHRLITAVRPSVVMGEQVAGRAGYGWLDGVRADLEGEGYASRGVDIPACAVDAPHIRQRLYWVACDMGDTNDARLERYARHGDSGERWSQKDGSVTSPSSSDMADADYQRRNGFNALLRENEAGRIERQDIEASGDGAGHMADTQNNGSSFGPHPDFGWTEDERRRDDDLRGEHLGPGSSICSDMEDPNGIGRPYGKHAQNKWETGTVNKSSGSSGSFWSNHVWLTGSDGKARRSKPSLPLLAHGIPARVGKLRAYGNAIVPPLAAEVIRAFMETEGENT